MEKEKKNLKYKIEEILAESVSLYNSEGEDEDNKNDELEDSD